MHHTIVAHACLYLFQNGISKGSKRDPATPSLVSFADLIKFSAKHHRPVYKRILRPGFLSGPDLRNLTVIRERENIYDHFSKEFEFGIFYSLKAVVNQVYVSLILQAPHTFFSALRRRLSVIYDPSRRVVFIKTTDSTRKSSSFPSRSKLEYKLPLRGRHGSIAL